MPPRQLLYTLNSPHPVFEGRVTYCHRLSSPRSNDTAQVPAPANQQRSWTEFACPSDAEFSGRITFQTRCRDHVAIDKYGGPGDSSRETHGGPDVADVPPEQIENDEGDDDTNASDDEGQTFDEDSTNIVTLDNYKPKPPSYKKANTLSYAALAKRLEVIWRQRKKPPGKGPSKQERLKYLLPDKLLLWLEGDSPFPFIRLILSDRDSSRAVSGLKEASIQSAYCSAMSLDKNSTHAKQINHYRDHSKGMKKDSVADLSSVISDVLDARGIGSKDGSDMTVGEVNDWVDVLVDLYKNRVDIASSEANLTGEKSRWRRNLERIATDSALNRNEKYTNFVKALLKRKLNPVEHKYIIRALLQNLHVGIHLKDIMSFYSPHALDIWHSFQSLELVCRLLSDPDYVQLLNATKDKNNQALVSSYRKDWMTPSDLPAKLNATISPMLSLRTTCDTFMKDVTMRHTKLDKALPADSHAKGCLAIQHPAFICEIKMDGERMLAHVKRGIVTIQTRNNVWYSPLYSPALGPSIREAISDFDVDCILDGEIIAWDNKEKKALPFGSNRTVAEWHRNRRARNGTLDDRDLNLHRGDGSINVMTAARGKAFEKSDGTKSKNLAGADEDDYWLQYVLFDILYVGGPDAEKLLNQSRHLFHKDAEIEGGSIINWDLMQRKNVLYNLIKPQKNMVEHIMSTVIRSDGTRIDGDEYFPGKGKKEFGRTPMEFDSIQLAMLDSDLVRYDKQRMRGKSHESIELDRALVLEELYSSIVVKLGQEGLMFKDLASPYYLGTKSRNMGYWRKLKPDYAENGLASDIDLVVIGGRYADGFDRRGTVSSLIVACVDDSPSRLGESQQLPARTNDDVKYMSLTKVNFNRALQNRSLDEILATTGFFRGKKDQTSFQLGKWFESNEPPSFMSLKSYQKNDEGDYSGWKPPVKDRPDIWIRPEDSFICTINAGEFQTASSMQAGFTLRFPRVSAYRSEKLGNPKAASEAQTWMELKELYNEQEEIRQGELTMGSQQQMAATTSRFMTAKQLEKSGKLARKTKSRALKEVKLFAIPNKSESKTSSTLLEGYIFNVLPGNYRLDNDPFASSEAEEGGWKMGATEVTSHTDVIRYIQSHGGTVELTAHLGTNFIIGGRGTDAKVSTLLDLMSKTDPNGTSKREEFARRLLELGGVHKWTFVFSMVTLALKQCDDEVTLFGKSIREHFPELAVARRSDYLAISDTAKQSLKGIEDDFGLRVDVESNLIDFERALEGVAKQIKSKGRANDPPPWLIRATKDFSKCDRWMFELGHQKMFPYSKAGSTGDHVIFYPDVFETFGEEEEADATKEKTHSLRWELDVMDDLSDIASVLPLVRAMGAFVSCHLHAGVTHVLCELKTRKSIKWSSRLYPHVIFADADDGRLLHERLISLEETASIRRAQFEVMLVTPVWVEERWNS